MKNKWFSYVKLYRNKGYLQSSGISWEEFCAGIACKPANLLALSGCLEERHKGLGLECMCDATPETLMRANDMAFGNFCCVDFLDRAALDRVTRQELAELLYFNHTAEPLHQFQIASLQNHYAYYSHDDDWFARIYMENLDDYRPVIAHKLMKELKGRKRSIAPPGEVILDRLFAMFEQGAAIDFERSSGESVSIYPIGDTQAFPHGVDSIHGVLDDRRISGCGSLCLGYNARKKSWQFY